jgi:hypothetical protein
VEEVWTCVMESALWRSGGRKRSTLMAIHAPGEPSGSGLSLNFISRPHPNSKASAWSRMIVSGGGVSSEGMPLTHFMPTRCHCSSTLTPELVGLDCGG